MYVDALWEKMEEDLLSVLGALPQEQSWAGWLQTEPL